LSVKAKNPKKVIVIGAGPGGLFCAYHLLKMGFQVDMYDQMSGVGKKFLVSGVGGLNLTHSEEPQQFCSRYGDQKKRFEKLLEDFSPSDLRDWCRELEVETFIGSSGRVFPKKMNAVEMLNNWMSKLKSFEGFQLFLNHRLIDILEDKTLVFENKSVESTDQSIILSLGGASWEKTGSDGKWRQFLEKRGVLVKPFRPMNCGFETPWTNHFISKIGHSPIKNIAVRFQGHTIAGEVMLTPFGVEGGAIYACSNLIRNQIEKEQKAVIEVDLKPHLSCEEILVRLKKKKNKTSMSNHLRKSINLDSSSILLLRELVPKEKMHDFQYLASKIKSLEIPLLKTRPLSEAISTSGGVCFTGLTDNFELSSLPGVYIVGEMLDFEAPTGGYLLQGTFSTAWRVIKSFAQ
jgi:uncharacterized flavoprotein (TIGR03862 family)